MNPFMLLAWVFVIVLSICLAVLPVIVVYAVIDTWQKRAPKPLDVEARRFLDEVDE